MCFSGLVGILSRKFESLPCWERLTRKSDCSRLMKRGTGKIPVLTSLLLLVFKGLHFIFCHFDTSYSHLIRESHRILMLHSSDGKVSWSSGAEEYHRSQ